MVDSRRQYSRSLRILYIGDSHASTTPSWHLQLPPGASKRPNILRHAMPAGPVRSRALSLRLGELAGRTGGDMDNCELAPHRDRTAAAESPPPGTYLTAVQAQR